MREEDVRLTYKFLEHKGETEIRLMNPLNARDVKSVFVYDEEAFVNVSRNFQNKYNIYVGINERKIGGKTSADVKSLNAIVFDVDSIHPLGLPATDAETRKARIVAQRLFDVLKQRGKNPFMAMSGNGWQIWMKVGVSLEGYDNKKIAAVLKDMYKEMMKEFSSEGAKIDNIGDLARVIKVIGTKSLKATTTQDRINRVSYWEIKPENVQPQVDWGMRLLNTSKDYESENLMQINAPTTELSSVKRIRYLIHFTPKMLSLFEGDWKRHGYSSRSEAEFALLCGMFGQSIPTEDAWLLMSESKIGKWNSAKKEYRSLSISRAYSFMNTN
jgi:hypothetical protein